MRGVEPDDPGSTMIVRVTLTPVMVIEQQLRFLVNGSGHLVREITVPNHTIVQNKWFSR